MTPEERFERIEANLEATTQGLNELRQGLDEFRQLVRGAFTLQQQQITDLRETVDQLAREWQAYLRTIHPPQ